LAHSSLLVNDSATLVKMLSILRVGNLTEWMGLKF